MKSIFITGHIKTGTSLMISLLDDHPELLVFPEELFLMSKYAKLTKDKRHSYGDYWELFFKNEQIKKLFNTKAEGLFGKVDYSDFDAERFRKECLSDTNEKTINRNDIVDIYKKIFISYAKSQSLDSNKHWVEKSPMNELNFFYWIEKLPDSQFIYMKRDPYEVYSSVKKKRRIEGQDYSIDNFIENYLTSIKVAESLQNKYPVNFKIIELKQLKNNTKSVMNSICDFLNINFNQTLLSPTKLGKPWTGNSMFRENHSNVVLKTNHTPERNKVINEKENKLINKFIISNKNPIFQVSFMSANFKGYLKLVFLRFRVYLFTQKIISL